MSEAENQRKETTMQLPSTLPILSTGKQAPGSGRVCAEQAVAWLVSGRLDLGDETDRPSCVQPVLNALAIGVNDRLTDARRMEMWPLILRQPGTARPEMEPVLSVRLACWLADTVADLRRPQDQDACDAAVAAARAWCDCPCEDHAATAHAAAADADATVTFAATPTAATYAATYAAATAHAAAADATAFAATAYAADAAFAAAAAARYAAARYAANAADHLLALLAGCQVECERVTGHVPSEPDVERIRRLGELVGTG